MSFWERKKEKKIRKKDVFVVLYDSWISPTVRFWRADRFRFISIFTGKKSPFQQNQVLLAPELTTMLSSCCPLVGVSTGASLSGATVGLAPSRT